MERELLRLIIVDDEKLVRELLERCINWNELGFEISGLASNAAEAMELVDTYAPDIVLTDISMPVTDGIELGKKIIEAYPHIKVVIVTGYNEFDYAKRSLEIGISDYILKPVNDEEISKVIIDLRDKILKEKKEKEEQQDLKKFFTDNFQHIKEKFLKHLISPDADKQKTSESLCYLGIDVSDCTCQVAIATSLFNDDIPRKEEQWLTLGLRHEQWLRQYIRQWENIYIIGGGDSVTIINLERFVDLLEVCENALNQMADNLNCQVSIGVGKKYGTCSDANLSYSEALAAVRYASLTSIYQTVSYHDIEVTSETESQNRLDNFQDLNTVIRLGIKDQALILVDQIYDRSLMNRKIKSEALKAVSIGILTILSDVVADLNLEDNQSFSNELALYEKILRCDTVTEMKDTIKKHTNEICDTIINIRHQRDFSIAEQVKAYISDQLFDHELSLSTTAKKFYVNPSYLSRTFKKETGETFIEHITRLRIEKAIHLLSDKKKKVYEIALEVGFQDPHYFGMCFKKFTGFTLSEYRDR